MAAQLEIELPRSLELRNCKDIDERSEETQYKFSQLHSTEATTLHTSFALYIKKLLNKKELPSREA